METRLGRLALVLALALGTAGCDHGAHVGVGSLAVRWQVKGNTCAQAGLASVQVTLLIDAAVVTSREGACETGELLVSDVPSGVYEVRVDGLDAGGTATYSVTAEGVDVAPGDPSVTSTLELAKVGAGLSLSWYFENNGLCSFNGVAEVDATVWYEHLELYHAVHGCDPFDEALEPLPADGVLGIRVPDLQVPEVDVVLFGLDRDGTRRYSGTRHVLLHEGRVVNVSVEMKACEGPCG